MSEVTKKVNQKRCRIKYLQKHFFLYPQHLSSSELANSSPDAVSSLSNQETLSHQVLPQKAADLYLTIGLHY